MQLVKKSTKFQREFMKIIKIFLLFSLCWASLAFSARAQNDFRIVKKITLGGEGGWDYLIADADSRRIFISRSSHVAVVDADSGAVVGDIADTAGVHGIAIAARLGKGFTSNGRDNSVTVFDLKTLKPIKKIAAGTNPDAIIFDSFSGKVFVFNGKSHDVTAIDAKAETVVGTTKLDGKPEFAASDGKGKVFVNIEDKNEITVIDAKNLKVLTNYALANCEKPTGLAFDAGKRRLFAVCSNKTMTIVNADTGKTIQNVPTGVGTDAAVFDAKNNLIFSSNGEGTLTIIKETEREKFAVAQNLQTQKGARTMAFDSKTGQLYLVTAEFGDTPVATPENPHPRPTIKPGTFTLLIVGRSK
jgi:YVTN family beta-propeller protein